MRVNECVGSSLMITDSIWQRKNIYEPIWGFMKVYDSIWV